jgi:hypothetical protein
MSDATDCVKVSAARKKEFDNFLKSKQNLAQDRYDKPELCT